MAWISVHESVDGPKLRNLYKRLGCSKFEAIGILNFLWFWGLNNADKNGRVLFVDREDIGRYLYGVGAGCELSPSAMVDTLIETGWLDETPEGMHIHDWEIWQDQWYKAMERRESDKRRKARSRGKLIPLPAPEVEDPPEIPPIIPEETPPDSPPDEGTTGTEEEKPKKKKPPKVKYADFVSMPEADYQKLVDKYGIEFTNKCIFELDNYKGSKGKRYADDYRAILSWVIDRVNEKNPGLMRRSMSSVQNYQSTAANPFEEYREEE